MSLSLPLFAFTRYPPTALYHWHEAVLPMCSDCPEEKYASRVAAKRSRALLCLKVDTSMLSIDDDSLSPHVMLLLLPFFSLLVQLVEAAPTNAASESSAPDPTSSNYRSIWSILGTCALTLIICTWNVSFPNITHEKNWYKVMLYRGVLALSALVTPEITTLRAYSEWQYASEIKEDFSSDHQWTHTHSFFALMGGFILQDGSGRKVLKTRADLKCLRDGKIVNPHITKKEISGRSKSDGLGNTILVLQLSWFILQVIARGVNGLAITLVELDTLALATLSLPLFFFWWSKPMAAESPHVFYSETSNSSLDGDRRKPSFKLNHNRSIKEWFFEITTGGADDGADHNVWVLSFVWMVFGALHLIAWDFQFPSQAEKTIWRVASFTLISAPCICFLAFFLEKIQFV
ncbi:hypothetical protein BDN67DRAFT_973762, partial [Paxillus ammoniavirescens]